MYTLYDPKWNINSKWYTCSCSHYLMIFSVRSTKEIKVIFSGGLGMVFSLSLSIIPTLSPATSFHRVFMVYCCFYRQLTPEKSRVNQFSLLRKSTKCFCCNNYQSHSVKTNKRGGWLLVDAWLLCNTQKFHYKFVFLHDTPFKKTRRHAAKCVLCSNIKIKLCHWYWNGIYMIGNYNGPR